MLKVRILLFTGKFNW